MTARKDADFQEIIVKRDDGIDYKFQGKLLVDEQHEPETDFGKEYWCGIIQIYHTKYPQGKSDGYGYILVTRRHQCNKEDEEVFVTSAGLVKDMGMVINLIITKFEEAGTIPIWVQRAINAFKEGKYVDASGVKQIK